MKVEQEALVWLRAAEHYDASLTGLVIEALASFRRKPGLDGLTRIYESNIGALAFAVLAHALTTTNVPRSERGYIYIRQQLRSHVSHHVLQSLVRDQAVPPKFRDTLISIDLGL